MKFQTPHDKTTRVKEHQRFTQPSMTIPDQTLSIPELIRRYAQGLPLGAPKVPMYEEDPEQDLLGGINWNTLDISEKQNFIKSAQNEIKDIAKRTKRKPNTPKEVQSEQNTD